MQEIEIKALMMYEKNLKYFSTNHLDIFKNLQIFDTSELSLTPKYELEYKDGYFDVIELATGNLLYACDSNEYAKQAAKTVNFNKTSSLFEGVLDYIVSQKQIDIVKTKKLVDSDIRDVLPIMHIAMKVAPKTTTMKIIDKFIFIGVGIGTHIVSINEKINSYNYLIIEDNIELFRLSLFTTPYYSLAETAQLTFSIAQNQHQFADTVTLFLEYSYFNNRYLKYFHFPAHDNTKIKLIQAQLARQSQHVFPYDISLSKYLLPLKRIASGYKTINIATKFAKSLFSHTPALVLAAGPSLKNNMDWLKEHQDKFVIIAASAILNTLYIHGIKPDIVTQIDGYTQAGRSCMTHLDGVDTQTFLKDVIFIFGTHVPDLFINILNKENIYFLDDGENYDGFDSISASCVGSMTAILAVKLGFEKIFLLGLDLAFDQKTGATHSTDHFQNNIYDLSKADEISNIISLRDSMVQTEGNFSKTVYTTADFLVSIRVLSNTFSSIKDETQVIYNLNQGAFFANTQPMHPKDIQIEYKKIDKSALYNKISTVFQTNSASGMDQNSLTKTKQRLQNGYDILALVKEYEKKSFLNEDKYMYDLFGLLSDILKSNAREDSQIIFTLTLYLRYVIPYITDIENTKEITKVMQHFKKLDKSLIEGILNIVNRYIDAIEEFLGEMEKQQV